MYQILGISNEVAELVTHCEEKCKEEFERIEEACQYNSLKVLSSFHKNAIKFS